MLTFDFGLPPGAEPSSTRFRCQTDDPHRAGVRSCADVSRSSRPAAPPASSSRTTDTMWSGAEGTGGRCWIEEMEAQRSGAQYASPPTMTGREPLSAPPNLGNDCSVTGRRHSAYHMGLVIVSFGVSQHD